MHKGGNKMVVWRFNNLYKADAEKVSKEIESISNATPVSILEYARNENSELHKCFEWDDTVAAEKYRLQQARNIVCNLVYQEKEEEPTKLRVFYNQSSTNTYKPTKVLVRNEDSYKELLMQAKLELRAFKNKYKMLTELEDIFKLID